VVPRELGPGELARLDTLLPSVKTRSLGLREDCHTAGFDIFFGSCCRSTLEQAQIMASGASSVMRSWHVVKRACDVYVYSDDGQLDMKGLLLTRYRIMHRLAEAAGGMGVKNLPFDQTDGYFRLKNGTRVADRGHVQWTDNLTWDAAFAQINGPGSATPTA